jgi:hypothetical protein
MNTKNELGSAVDVVLGTERPTALARTAAYAQLGLRQGLSSTEMSRRLSVTSEVNDRLRVFSRPSV